MKKILKIVLPILLIGLFVSITVCYSLYPEQTRNFAESLKEFASQPIPIAGFSTLTVGGAILLIVRYVISKSNYGKAQLQEMRKELADSKERIEIEKERLLATQKFYLEEANKNRKDLVEVCKLIPNKKVNEFGNQIETSFSNLENELSNIDERINEYVAKGKEIFDNKTEEN